MGESQVNLFDYGAGNVRSVMHALDHQGSTVTIVTDPREIDAGVPVVVPGVGSFAGAMERLRVTGFDKWFDEHVRNGETPYLGICVGMQILATGSDEAPAVAGLGLIDAEVVALEKLGELRTPRIGFDSVRFQDGSPMTGSPGSSTDFYFCHGFGLPSSAPFVDAVSGTGDGIGVALRRDNVWATQFHLEKSQANGLAVLSRFLETFC